METETDPIVQPPWPTLILMGILNGHICGLLITYNAYREASTWPNCERVRRSPVQSPSECSVSSSYP